MSQDSERLTYAQAGVNIEAGNRLVDRIRPLVKATARVGADAAIGGFGGIFDLARLTYTDPLLVAANDGVGTKLRIAIETGRHDSIGIDLVAMSVNDLIVQGAEPLFFLDYFACGVLESDVATAVIAGIAAGCQQAGCALIGGETAEMPGMYAAGEYDLAGFAVGIVERARLLPSARVAAGDVVLGLPSSGFHSNGYSLVRKVIARAGRDWSDPCDFASDMTLGEACLEPTRIYVRALLPLLQQDHGVKALAHITGGGFTDNIPRVLPDGLGVRIDLDHVPVLPAFRWLARAGNIEETEMLRTFNCGIGMVLVVAQGQVPYLMQELTRAGEHPVVLGEVIPVQGSERVHTQGSLRLS